MKFGLPPYLLLVVPFTALAGLSAGCSPDRQSQPVAPEQQIAARAEARWAALARGDFAAAYAFETPAFRAVTDLEAFRGQYGSHVHWYGATVKRVDRKEGGDVAEVLLRIEYALPLPGGEVRKTHRGAKETWIRKDGAWWFLHE